MTRISTGKNTFLGRSWPALIVIILYLVSMAVMLASALGHTDGRLVYPLDDTYIHMSISRTFARTGVWGISPAGFTSSTSAPLWTLILAVAYFLSASPTLTPLILNIIAGVILIVYLFHILRRYAGPVLTFIYLLLITAAIPLPALTITAMEHVLQVLLIVIFADLGVRTVLTDGHASRTGTYLLILAPFVSTIRYESAFIIGVFFLLFLSRRRFRFALLLGLLAALPLVVYAVISVAQGWMPLPNSVLIKGARPFHSYGPIVETTALRFFKQSMVNPHMLILALLGLLTYWIFRARTTGADGKSNKKHALTAAVFVYTACLHLQFAQTGWFYRYEAYVVTLGFVAVFPLVTHLLERIRSERVFRSNGIQTALLSLMTLALLITPFCGRAVRALVDTPRAMHDRYLEHVLPAEFLARHYPHSPILINDIGAVSFYSTSRILDVCGIGSVEPILCKLRTHDHTKEDVREWAVTEGVEIAVVQITYVRSLVPDDWMRVATWDIPRNVVFGDKRISFFATNIDAARILARNLGEYVPALPKEITVTIGDEFLGEVR